MYYATSLNPGRQEAGVYMVARGRQGMGALVTKTVVHHPPAFHAIPRVTTTASDKSLYPLSHRETSHAGIPFAVPPEMVALNLAAQQQNQQPPMLHGLLDPILNALGIRDPLTAIEPELAAAGRYDRIWGKYDDLINRYSKEVGSLQSSGIRAQLLGTLGTLGRLRDKLRPFFPSGGAEGVVVGEKEKKELGELVQGVDDFRHEYGTAKRKYGLVPQTEAPEAGAPPAGPLQETPAMIVPDLPWGWILVAGAALILGVKMLKKKAA